MADAKYVTIDDSTEADGLFSDGEAALRRCPCWPWVDDQRVADAAELFKSAGSKYTQRKMYRQAGGAYVKAGRCLLRLGDQFDAAEMFSRGCISYRNVPDYPYDDVIAIYIEAINLYEDTENPGKAAKLLQDVGVYEEERADWRKAVEAYEEAVTLLFTETKEAQAHQLQLKVADIWMANMQYPRAAELFEKTGIYSSASTMLRWSVTTYFFKAVLCLIASEAFQKRDGEKSVSHREKPKDSEDEDEESKHMSDSEQKEEHDELGAAYAAMERFEEQHPPSAGSKEFKFVEELMTCYHARDKPGFDTAVQNNAYVYLDKPALVLVNHLKTAPIWTEQPSLQ